MSILLSMLLAGGKMLMGYAANEFSSLNPALAQKFGYDSTEELFKGAQEKFSLVSTGVVQKPSCRLLLINVSLSFSFPTFLSRRILGSLTLSAYHRTLEDKNC